MKVHSTDPVAYQVTPSSPKIALPSVGALVDHYGSITNALKAGDPAVKQAVFIAEKYYFETIERVGDEKMNHPDAVRRFLSIRLCDLEHESFCVLFLDSRLGVLSFEEMFRGTVDGASVFPREVVKRALEHNATMIIVAHNHPSGSSEPSQADRILTRRLADACRLFDIMIKDHFVIGKGEIASFAERGWL